jgi:spoIIIJ-associated protein
MEDAVEKNIVEKSAASVELAIKEALADLRASEDEVTIEVLATPRGGVLGLGVRQARVRVTRRRTQTAASPVQSPPRSSRPQSRPEPPRQPDVNQAKPAPQSNQQLQRRSETPQSQPRRDQRPRQQPRNSDQQRERNRAPLSESEPSRREDSAGASGEDMGGGARKSADLAEQSREAADILRQILDRMGEKGEIRQSDADPESVELEIKGDGSGILIGRHGQTLDALEYIVNRILARRIKDAAPISLETEAYRARRRGQLHRMALAMGERAKREHQSVRLDPMPPRDRRVVHMALKDDPMITTRSAGDGFLRSIEILPVGVSGAGNRREQTPDGQGQGRGRRRDRERPRDNDRSRENPGNEKPSEKVGNEALGEQGGFKHGQKRIV